MPAPSPSNDNLRDLVETIRSNPSAEQKKIAAATIALTLIKCQALGNSGYDPSAAFGSFGSFVASIQSSITNV